MRTTNTLSAPSESRRLGASHRPCPDHCLGRRLSASSIRGHLRQRISPREPAQQRPLWTRMSGTGSECGSCLGAGRRESTDSAPRGRAHRHTLPACNRPRCASACDTRRRKQSARCVEHCADCSSCCAATHFRGPSPMARQRAGASITLSHRVMVAPSVGQDVASEPSHGAYRS
jgi:hypothetical protein